MSCSTPLQLVLLCARSYPGRCASQMSPRKPASESAGRPQSTFADVNEDGISYEDEKRKFKQSKDAAKRGQVSTAAPSDTSGQPPVSEAGGQLASWIQTIKAKATPDMILCVAAVFVCIAAMHWVNMHDDPHKKVFSKKLLPLYNGKMNHPYYLAILGEVFDVTKGKKKYEGGKGGYGFFLGKDASRAFVTGDFEKDLNDDMRGLSNEQYHALVEWRAFYRKEYMYKGKAVGRFYDAQGNALTLLSKVEEGAKHAQSQEEATKALDAAFPKCNVRWTEAEGGTVWCDDGKYPRKIFQQLPGGKPTTRCACFSDIGWSDIRQIYPTCSPEASTCRLVEA